MDKKIDFVGLHPTDALGIITALLKLPMGDIEVLVYKLRLQYNSCMEAVPKSAAEMFAEKLDELKELGKLIGMPELFVSSAAPAPEPAALLARIDEVEAEVSEMAEQERARWAGGMTAEKIPVGEVSEIELSEIELPVMYGARELDSDRASNGAMLTVYGYNIEDMERYAQEAVLLYVNRKSQGSEDATTF